jgi:hypothetical protein
MKSGKRRRIVLCLCAAGFLVAAGAGGATAQTYTTGGTGILVTSSGYILTAYHIVEGATGPISVTLGDGTKYEAELVGYSPTFEDGGYDAALLKIPAVNLPTIALGNSDDVQLFDQVIVLGYPLSFELGVNLNTTGGNVTAFRDLEDSPPLFQIDAAINPGNSGGPVLDGSGYAIGIVTSKLVGETVEGVSFAVPIRNAIELVSKHIPEWSAAPAGTPLTAREIVAQATPAVVYIEWSDAYVVDGRYEEDFSRERDWYAEFWVREGHLEVSPDEEGVIKEVLCPCDALGPFFEVEITFAQCRDDGCAAGIAFYAPDETQWSYLLLISPDGMYSFYKASPSGGAWIPVDSWEESRRLRTGLGVSNRVGIEASETVAFLSINGQRAGSLSAVLPLGGSMALCAISFEGGATVRFDNLKVYDRVEGAASS